MSPLSFGIGNSRAFGVARSSSASPYWLQSLNYYPVSSQSDGYYIADIAKDNGGNIYVLGNSSYDISLSSHCLITKFNTAGDVQWVARIPTDASTIRHFGYNLHVTPDGATIHIVGGTWNAAAQATSYDTLVIKITTSGISSPGEEFPVETYRMYTTDYEMPSPEGVQENSIRSVVDSSGNIYITCWYYTGIGILTKCSISSNTLNVAWSKKITTSAGGGTSPFALHLDSSGNVYWVGNSSNTPNIAKHNSANGDLIWCKTINTTDYILISGTIYIDANDNIYISGISGRLATGNYGLLLTKLNPSGSLVWQRILQSSTFSSSELFAGGIATTDTSNNVYVAGAINEDLIFVKFNATNGNDLFQRSFGGASNDTSYISRRLLVDSNSLIFANVIGAEQRAGLVSKLPSDGSKTGTYTIQIDDVNYSLLNYSMAYSTVSTATNSDVTSTTTVSDRSLTLTNAIQTTSVITETGFIGLRMIELYKTAI